MKIFTILQLCNDLLTYTKKASIVNDVELDPGFSDRILLTWEEIPSEEKISSLLRVQTRPGNFYKLILIFFTLTGNLEEIFLFCGKIKTDVLSFGPGIEPAPSSSLVVLKEIVRKFGNGFCKITNLHYLGRSWTFRGPLHVRAKVKGYPQETYPRLARPQGLSYSY